MDYFFFSQKEIADCLEEILSAFEDDRSKLKWISLCRTALGFSFRERLNQIIKEDDDLIWALESNLLDSNWNVYILQSIRDEEKREKTLEKFVDRINSRELTELILSFSEDIKRIQLLKKYQDYPIFIGDILSKLQLNGENYSLINPKIEELFQKYPIKMSERKIDEFKRKVDGKAS